ncbi:MAG TPA: PAS domain S-box protein, partial [Kofleriaceae bacterium]|nr:PAS domain S-box protein [Kofleriaceae bacterium]
DHGEFVGTSMAIRDVSAAREAQRALAALNIDLEGQVAERTAMLEETARDLRTVLDAVPSTISYWDRQLTNRFSNQALSQWLGVDPAALRNRHLHEVLPPSSERMVACVEAVLRGEPQAYERELVGADGATRHLFVHYVPDIVAGEVRGFYVIAHDITELVVSRHRLAAAQHDNEALLETIKHHAIVSVTDGSGRILEVSDRFCAISGYTRDELVGETHELVSSRTHPSAFWQDVWRTIASGKVWRGEICNRAKDGSLHWVDSLISPFTGVDGNIERYISIRTDVTARKRAAAEMAATSSLLNSVLDSATEASVVATDLAGNITVFNRGAERLLGYRADEMVGRATPARLHLDSELAVRGAELPASMSSFDVLVHHARETGVDTREWTYVRADGSHVEVSLTVTAMRDGDGNLLGYLGIAHDVSRHKQIERSLRETMHAARKANLAKSQFLANMSHEIRTPMNAVIGLSYLLERTTLDAEQFGFLAKIKLASKSLLAIINNVLDLSKIEAAELKLERAPFDLGMLVEEISSLMSIAAEAKGIRFELDTDISTLAVEGDATRVHQVLINLIANAIKFTEKGSVRFAVHRLACDDDVARVRFTVQDTGIGIAREALGRLFAPFAQADTSTTRRFGGTGLGLSIVKQLVGLMGGEVTVTSHEGIGSTFSFELAMRRSELALAAPIEAGPALALLGGVRILIADDSAINLEVARRILEHEGASVQLCSNGQEAVEALLARPDPYDIVLMDLQMPVLDGFDATERIRRGLGLTALPIIALTAGTLSSEQQRALAAGMTELVSKPFEPAHLIGCIRRHTRPAVAVPQRATLPQRADVPATWPIIEGISTAEVHHRLCGDLGLFRKMLRRVLGDFTGLAGSPDLAGRLHDLKGAAGTLGATEIYGLAVDAEAAAVRGDAAAANGLAARIDTAVVALASRASAWLAVEPTPARRAADGDLVELARLLRESDLAAITAFQAAAGQLRERLGEAFAQLSHHVETLDFAAAATTVEALAA